jgi:cytochrome c6
MSAGAKYGVLAAGFLAAIQASVAADVINGQRLYLMHCASCHGQNGHAAMPNAPSFDRGERLMQPDSALWSSIRRGRFAMPAYAGVLSDREIFDIVAYLRSLR